MQFIKSFKGDNNYDDSISIDEIWKELIDIVRECNNMTAWNYTAKPKGKGGGKGGRETDSVNKFANNLINIIMSTILAILMLY